MHGMLLDEVGVDLAVLEERVAKLERQLHSEFDVIPPALQELKQQVDGFRTKLETTEHLSWLGFYKQLPEPLMTDECRPLRYRRKTDSVRKRVKERFLQISDTKISEHVRYCLRMSTFDSRPWEDEEVLLLLQQMFIDLELCEKFGIDMHTLRKFLFEIYNNYNDVPFHNFRHCFCVTQMMYTMIWATNLRQRLGDLEVLILLVSSICHDLDHPGYNNIYQINAKTELALRYNDISPLENHHCSVAFRVLARDDCNIFQTMSGETFRRVREGMIRCILATDMARHNDILTQFQEVTPVFDFSDKTHTDLLAMILIKVADISNEARPMDVAEPWLDRLLQEFFKQSDAEKLEGLPVTPFMDREKITKPSSQCSFIGLVLLPLFEALGALLTELHEVIVQPVRDALDYYRRLNDATKEKRLHRKSVVAELLAHPALARSSVGCPSQNHNFIYRNLDSSDPQNAVPNASLQSRKGLLLRSRSRSTEETVIAVETDEEPNLADLIEDDESDGSETATEVEVCEKAFKFKISTDSSISNAGSRKSSRDRTQIAKDLEKRRGKFTSTLSFDGATLKRSPMEMQESAEILRKFKGRSFDRGRCGDTQSPVSDQSLDFLAEIEIARKCDAEATHPDDIASEEVLFDEIIVEEASPQVKASPSSNPRSFLSRLRQFTDRFYLSECKNAKLSPILPGKQLHEEHAKASTLPKAMKRSADKATRCVGEMGEEFAANSLGNITSKKLDGHSVPGSSQSGTTAASTENFLVQSEGQSCPQEQTPAVDL